MTKIRFNHTLYGDDLTDTSPLNASAPRYLPEDFASRNKRLDPRPKIMSRTMPQRQHPFPASAFAPGVQEKLSNMMSDLAAQYPEILILAPSKTEGGSTSAIYANKAVSTLNPIVKDPRNKLLDGEIAHAHPAESSLHVWLSEADTKAVVDSGWGLRFPLTFVDKGWTMVYAPRTMEELAIVEEIVKAAIGFLTGVKV